MTTATAPDSYLLSILEARHMTATINTRSGNSYTIVSRDRIGVLVIDETRGTVAHCHRLFVIDGRLVGTKDGKDVLSTTLITHVNILTN